MPVGLLAQLVGFYLRWWLFCTLASFCSCLFKQITVYLLVTDFNDFPHPCSTYSGYISKCLAKLSCLLLQLTNQKKLIIVSLKRQWNITCKLFFSSQKKRTKAIKLITAKVMMAEFHLTAVVSGFVRDRSLSHSNRLKQTVSLLL